MKFSAATLAFAFTFVTPASAALCPLAFEGISGLNTEYALPSEGKLNVVDFTASVTYATLAAGRSRSVVSNDVTIHVLKHTYSLYFYYIYIYISIYY